MGESDNKRPRSLKEPLLHFFVLGLVVFGLRAWFDRPEPVDAEPTLIAITSAEIDWFRTLFKKRMTREPITQEIRGQVDLLVREQILSREAKRLGLDEGDQIVRRRLAQKMDYLFKDMAAGLEPTDEQVQSFLQQHRERYVIPGETSFDQVYFSLDQRGYEGARQAVVDFLNNPISSGDTTMIENVFVDASEMKIRGAFGTEFSESLNLLEAGKWQGPVQSGFGLHAVFIHSRTPELLPSTDDIRQRLTEDWRFEQQRISADEIYGNIRSNYQVLVEGMPYVQDMN